MPAGMTSIADLAPGERVILISRVVDAPRDLVFEAFTNPKHLTRFWGPKGFDCTDCKVDLRVGGTFSIMMRGPDGNSYPATGVYEDVTPPEQIVYSGTANEGHPCGGGIPPRSTVTMRFTEEGARKTKIVVHSLLQTSADKDAAIAGGFSIGWNDSIDRLEAFLAGP
jgi:uncharacterized protein YndB with AHSA1/START domain